MKASICFCGKPVTLFPSASERARKFGGTPQDYIKLFPNHADCVIKKRQQDVSRLIERRAAQ